MKQKRTKTVVGIDLAGSPKRPTGACTLRGRSASDITELSSDEEILRYLNDRQPDLVAIDAPLSLPPGRRSIHDRNGRHLRVCDVELQRRGIRFFPITLGPMRMLTERGIHLMRRIEKMRMKVIEIYPGGAQDLWNIPRKQGGLERLRRSLEELGIKGLSKGITGDELDAVSAAIVGGLFLRGKADVYGSIRRGAIVMPKSPHDQAP
ncbi:MAG: DUF429 domain-containing protein [Bacteroidota bacterium]